MVNYKIYKNVHIDENSVFRGSVIIGKNAFVGAGCHKGNRRGAYI